MGNSAKHFFIPESTRGVKVISKNESL